jgi:hypothetical protein
MVPGLVQGLSTVPPGHPEDGGGRGVIFGRLMVNTALSTVKGPAKFPEVRCGPGTDLSE